jgi:hypothetical protein
MGITVFNAEIWVIGAAGLVSLAATVILLVRWPRLRLTKT